MSNYIRNSDGTLTPATPMRGSWWVRVEMKLRRTIARSNGKHRCECACVRNWGGSCGPCVCGR